MSIVYFLIIHTCNNWGAKKRYFLEAMNKAATSNMSTSWASIYHIRKNKKSYHEPHVLIHVRLNSRKMPTALGGLLHSQCHLPLLDFLCQGVNSLMSLVYFLIIHTCNKSMKSGNFLAAMNRAVTSKSSKPIHAKSQFSCKPPWQQNSLLSSYREAPECFLKIDYRRSSFLSWGEITILLPWRFLRKLRTLHGWVEVIAQFMASKKFSLFNVSIFTGCGWWEDGQSSSRNLHPLGEKTKKKVLASAVQQAA